MAMARVYRRSAAAHEVLAVGFQFNQFLSQRRGARFVAAAPVIVDPDVLAVRSTKSLRAAAFPEW
jgi:hypothetical protein